ncbi:unnamed protein product [Symbiodinium natans]|uniref:PDZ domain-containing protein n=1 Tax=Symbiodinium natans TaxID=878477 RepID=A0A812J7D4_9DINO|nr:unnamed protein product [Symbiodinium natans]
MSLTLSPRQAVNSTDTDLGVEFGTQKPTGFVRQALPLKHSENEYGVNSFVFTPPQDCRLDEKSPLAGPCDRRQADAASGQQVTHAAMVSQLADPPVPTWAQAAQAAPSASSSSVSGRSHVPEVPLWSTGVSNGTTLAPLPAPQPAGATSLNKRRIFLRYVQGDAPQIDLANLNGGQGSPVIIQAVTPGGRAEQNGVKPGAVIRSVNASTTFRSFPAWQVRAMLHAPVTVEVEQDMVLSPASPRCKEIRLTRKSELKLGIAPRNGAWSQKDNVLLAEEVVFKPRTAPLWISSYHRDLVGSVPEGRIVVDTIDLPRATSPVIYELRRPEAHRLVDNAVRTAWATVSKEADHVARVPRGSRSRSHSPFCGLEECLPQWAGGPMTQSPSFDGTWRWPDPGLRPVSPRQRSATSRGGAGNAGPGIPRSPRQWQASGQPPSWAALHGSGQDSPPQLPPLPAASRGMWQDGVSSPLKWVSPALAPLFGFASASPQSSRGLRSPSASPRGRSSSPKPQKARGDTREVFDDEHLAAKPVYGTYGADDPADEWGGQLLQHQL